MSQVMRNNFQSHPFHLVSPSPWPLNTSISLFTLAASGTLCMHSFSDAYYIFNLTFVIVVGSMSF